MVMITSATCRARSMRAQRLEPAQTVADERVPVHRKVLRDPVHDRGSEVFFRGLGHAGQPMLAP